MPTFRQSLVASITRRYPLYSGCVGLANKSFVQKLSGSSNERVWSQVPGGEVLTSLDDFMGRAAYYVGDLDRKVTWICSQIVRPGDIAIDIGANMGSVSLWLASLVGKNGRVHAFEPNPKLQDDLQETFDRNQISHVRLHPVALGAQESQLDLWIPGDNAGEASLVRRRETAQECTYCSVPVRPLSNIVSEEGIKSIRLMKIDVEGFEAEVLEGAREVLRSLRPQAIFFEVNKFKKNVRDLCVIKILQEYDYSFFAIPKCLFRMRLEPFDPMQADKLPGNDLLAVPKGECYQEIGTAVRAI